MASLKNMTMLLLALLIVAAPTQASICELGCAVYAPMSSLANPTRPEAMPMHPGHCSGTEESSAARKSSDANSVSLCDASGCQHVASFFEAATPDDNRATAMPLFIEALPFDLTLPRNGPLTGHNPLRLAARRSPLLPNLRV